MATNFVKNMAHSHFSQSGIQNGLQYYNFYFIILSRMNFSTLCTILVTFGPVALEIVRVTTALCFGGEDSNRNCVACSPRGSAYFFEYLQIYWTDFRNLFTI